MNEDRKDAVQTIVEGRGLVRDYLVGKQGVHALGPVSLQVKAGDALCIMGASGAGKSTLLHILGGLDRPSAGEVHFKGDDLYKLSATRRAQIRSTQIGFVFQSFHLLPELDVVENVMLPAMSRMGFVGRAGACRERANELLVQVGLDHRSTHRPLELSGGEQQRVALARSLMNDPELILADEPTGNLDSRTGGQVLEYLFALTNDRGHTLIVVTHNAAIAEKCSRTLTL